MSSGGHQKPVILTGALRNSYGVGRGGVTKLLLEGLQVIDDDLYDEGVRQCPKCGNDIGRGGFCDCGEQRGGMLVFLRRLLKAGLQAFRGEEHV